MKVYAGRNFNRYSHIVKKIFAYPFENHLFLP